MLNSDIHGFSPSPSKVQQSSIIENSINKEIQRVPLKSRNWQLKESKSYQPIATWSKQNDENKMVNGKEKKIKPKQKLS